MFLYSSKNIILSLVLLSVAGILYSVSGICQQERYIFNEISAFRGFEPEIFDVATDSNKNIVVCGNLRGTTSYKNQVFPHGDDFPFIAKLDSAHNLLWIEGSEVQGLLSNSTHQNKIDLVEVDEDGNIYASGVFINAHGNQAFQLDSVRYGNQTIDFTVYSGNFAAVRIIFKFSSNGNLIWSRYGADAGRDPSLRYKNGHVYFTLENRMQAYNQMNNSLVRTVNGDSLNFPTNVHNQTVNAVVFKLDTAGNTQWFRTLVYNSFTAGTGSMQLNDIEVDDRDNVYVIGRAAQSPVFNNQQPLFPTFANQPEPFVVKIDSTGNLAQSRRFLNIPASSNQNWRVSLQSALVGQSLYIVNATVSPANYDGITAPQGYHVLKMTPSLNPVESFSLLKHSQSFVYVPFFGALGDQLAYTAILRDSIAPSLTPPSEIEMSLVNITDTTFNDDKLVRFLKYDQQRYGWWGGLSFQNRLFSVFNAVHSYPDSGWVVVGSMGQRGLLEDHRFPAVGISGFIAKAIKCRRPDINLTSNSSAICGPGGSANLTAVANSNFSFRWFMDSNRIQGANGPNYLAGTAGNYMFESDSLGCKDTSNVIALPVSSQPAVFTYPAFETVCSSSLPMRLLGGVPSGGTWHGNGMVNDSVFDPAVSGLGIHFLWYVYENSLGCVDSAMRLITVEPGPQPTLFPPDFCHTDPQTDVSSFAFPQGGFFRGNGFVGANQFNPQIAGSGTSNFQYTVITSNGCTLVDTGSIYVDPGPSVTLPQIPNVCESEPFLALPAGSPSGGTWSGNNVAGGLFFTQGLTPGSHEVIYEASQNGCSAQDTTVINVFPENSIFSLPSVICESDSPHVFQVYPPGGTFSGAGVVNDSLFNPGVAGAGNFTIDYATNNVCGTDTASRNITVLPYVQSQINPLPQICESDSAIALTGTPAGGTFSGLGIVQNQLLPEAAGAGNVEIVYTAQNNNLCPSYDTIQANILPAPVISTSFPDSLCQNSGLISLNASPAGGLFSGTNVTGNNFNTDTVQGDYLVHYTYQDSNQCTSTATDTIAVYDIPAPSWNVPGFLCNDLQQRVLLEGTPGGGTISGAHITGNIFDVQAAGDGLHPLEYSISTSCGVKTAYDTIRVEDKVNVTHPSVIEGCAADSIVFLTGGSPSGGHYTGANIFIDMYFPPTPQADTISTQYVLTSGGCVDTASVTVILREPPATVINIQDSVCLNAAPFSLTGSPTGGIFSGVGITGNIFNPAAADTGFHGIEYEFTDSIGCSGRDTTSIRVYDTEPPPFSIPKSVCLNAAPIALTNHSPAGGTFSGTGVTQGEFHPAAAGVGLHPITYTVNTDCGPKTTTDTVEVLPLPAVSLPALPDLCNTDTLYMTGGSPQGGIYFGNFVDSNAFNAYVSGAGQFTVYYRYTDSNMCSDTVTTAIQVQNPPIVQFQFQDSVCADAPPLNIPQGNLSGGTFNGSGVFQQAFHADSAGIGLHDIIYEYHDSNGCLGADTQQVVVFPEPAANWTAPSGICSNSSPVTLTGGQPAGGTFQGLGVVNNVLHPAIAGSGSHAVRYEIQTQCGLKSVTDTIIIHPEPSVQLDSFPNICVNATPLVLSGGYPQGGVYSGNHVSNGLFYPSNAGAGQDTVYYTYTNTFGCAGTDSQIIFVDSLPNVALDTLAPVCYGDTLLPLTGGNPQGGVFSGPGITGNFINPRLAGSGNRLIFYIYEDANGCSNFDFKNLEIYPEPTGNFDLPNSICLNDDSVLITSISPSGGIFEGLGSGSTLYFNPVRAGPGITEITYRFTDQSGCRGTHSEQIEVLNTPEYVKNDIELCKGDEITLSLNTNDSIFWFGSSVGSLNIKPEESQHYPFKAATNAGCEIWDSLFVDVIPLPDISLGGDRTICDTGQLIIGSDQNYKRYLWNNGSTLPKKTIYPALLAKSVHVYWLEAENKEGCVKRDSVYLTVIHCPITGFVERQNQNMQYKLYPNPASADFYLEVTTEVMEEVEISVRNGTGATVYSTQRVLNQKKNIIAFEHLNLESGVYFITVKGKEIFFTESIVIIK